MATQEAIDWAKRQLAAGFTQEELRKAMADSGYSQKDIGEVLSATKQPALAPKPVTAPVPVKKVVLKRPVPTTPAKLQPASQPRPMPVKSAAVVQPKPKPAAGRASRAELFIRFFYTIPLAIVVFFIFVLLPIIVPLEWLYILVFSKRNDFLDRTISGCVAYYFNATRYVMLLTDERPPIIGNLGNP